MTKEEKLTMQFIALRESIRAFVRACPDFPGGDDLAGAIGKAIAHVEITLHWDFGCWELALPRVEKK